MSDCADVRIEQLTVWCIHLQQVTITCARSILTACLNHTTEFFLNGRTMCETGYFLLRFILKESVKKKSNLFMSKNRSFFSLGIHG